LHGVHNSPLAKLNVMSKCFLLLLDVLFLKLFVLKKFNGVLKPVDYD